MDKFSVYYTEKGNMVLFSHRTSEIWTKII